MKPSKLTPDVHRQIIEFIKTGVRIKTACEAAGIAYSTHRTWMLRGEAEETRLKQAGTKARKAEKPYLEYMEAIKKARAELEAELLEGIENAITGGKIIVKTVKRFDRAGNLIEQHTEEKRVPPSWQAAAWKLERMFGYIRTG